MVDFLYWGKKIGGFALESFLNDLKDPSKFTNNIHLPNSYNRSDQDTKFNWDLVIKTIVEELVRCAAAKWYQYQQKNKGNETES